MSEAGLPLEIERKFLIALPDAALLGKKSVKRLAIAQVYLRAGTSGAGRRIRRARCGDETRYYYTEKTRVTAVTRIEREHEITAAEFEALLSERDEALRTVERDPLLEQMMAEEREREAAYARGEVERTVPRDAGGLQGAGGMKGAREARKLEKLRDRKADSR